MFGYVCDDNIVFFFISCCATEKVKIITAGFITVDAGTDNIQSGKLRIAPGQKILLDLLGQVQ